MKKFTGQEILDMGAELFDNCGFTRAQIRQWLTILVDNGHTEEINFEAIMDLIVG